jgi:copper chaperone CopZ
MTQTITLVAPDISCGHCVQTVENVAGAQPGVVSVKADSDTKLVTIEIEPATASLSAIEAALAEAGYPAAK